MISIYLTDPFLANSRKRYATFIKVLKRRGLVGFTRQPKEFVGVFFAWKKSGKLRLILEARAANRTVRDPPHVDMLSSEGLGSFGIEHDARGGAPASFRVVVR